MANERYNFKYLPLVGKLPGKSMVEQTETAINELASVIYDNVGHVGNLAEEVQTANNNASNALEKATEALETSGRIYITLIAAVDVNDYYDSELYYIDNDGSTNIPVRDRGFLEVKTNDDKTACEQVFIADSTGTPYYRHGVITEQTLGEETTYVVTWGSWYHGATTEYVQGELTNYLPLSGGTLTGVVNGVTPPNGDNSKKLATTEFVNAKAGNYLPLSGGTMTGGLTVKKTITGNLAGTATNAEKMNTTGGERDLIRVTMATTDTFRLRVGGSPNEGWVELATGDDASEPIYVRQYSYIAHAQDVSFGAMRREAALLDASGNTSFPGTVTAPNFTGLASKATADAAGNNIQSTYVKKSDLSSSTPTGVVQAFAGRTTPQGWLLCDGSAVSRTDYAALYAVIGTTYGAGNGSTTFNLPNLVDKFVEGSATAGTQRNAGLPNITGSITKIMYYSASSATGAFWASNSSNVRQGDGSPHPSTYDYDFNASRSNSIYGKSTTVQPPALTMRYIIKY